MNVENKLESLKFFSQSQRREHHNRQQHEWKILFTILAFFVLSVVAVHKYSLSAITWFRGLSWIVFLCLAVIASVYLLLIHLANHKNRSFAERAEHAIEAILNGNDPKINLFGKPPPWSGKWAWICQTIMIFLAAAATILMTRS